MSWLEFFCCYSNQYSLRSLLRRSQKKCILSHNHKTSHFSGVQRMFPYTLHPLMIHREATPGKFSVYSPYAVPSFVFLEDTLDFRGYIRISLLNFICFSDLIIIGRLRQLHRCQQIFQGISFFTEFFDKRCFCALSCAAHLFLYALWRFWPFPFPIHFHAHSLVLTAVFHIAIPPILGVQYWGYRSRCAAEQGAFI